MSNACSLDTNLTSVDKTKLSTSHTVVRESTYTGLWQGLRGIKTRSGQNKLSIRSLV